MVYGKNTSGTHTHPRFLGPKLKKNPKTVKNWHFGEGELGPKFKIKSKDKTIAHTFRLKKMARTDLQLATCLDNHWGDTLFPIELIPDSPMRWYPIGEPGNTRLANRETPASPTWKHLGRIMYYRLYKSTVKITIKIITRIPLFFFKTKWAKRLKVRN